MERKLVGEWLSGCSIDICSVTKLNADRTFSNRFDEKDFPEPNYSGTWHVEGDQLVMHVSWADKPLQDIIGKDLRLIVSAFQQKKFVAISAEHRTKAVTWERRQ
jgi:hypothetical protein